ncbi:MAG: D-hexose-6-phosphate mutarotase [Hylemonella sp.]|uniref:D-hexose-6-phosphate mutarotase n=1 Tax=Hylemonella sp. TaxID=2066020 RepID=UPI0022C183D3|nr:D-hexose-6-phosphate mutarotase [Hylemonella sp.]MCZ8253754.1 D-hexose-6-phosphate mutarotase [Hylemonella sp.]
MAEAVDSRALFHGLPSHVLRLPQGDQVRVLQHGAHTVSWVTGGRERFFLSPRARFDCQSAIRGGVPVCFPQFNQRGPLPKHGFARNLPWEMDGPPVCSAESASLTLCLRDSEATRAHWPQAFEARLRLDLSPGSLQITLSVRNTDTRPLAFSGALHSYLAVDDIGQAMLEGLQGQAEWDAVRDYHGQASGTLRFDGEFDRVYTAAPRPLLLRERGQALEIAQSPSWGQTVVWNPGAALCATLADMPADGHLRMLCVEAAQVLAPIQVPAGGAWSGWQRLTAR